MTASILVVDDEPAITRLVRIVLEREGYVVYTTNSPEAGLSQLTELNPDIIVLDLFMPEMNGRTFHQRAREGGYAGPFLILSAFGARTAGVELDAANSLEKPFDPAELVRLIAKILSPCPSPP